VSLLKKFKTFEELNVLNNFKNFLINKGIKLNILSAVLILYGACE
jgi:hypothetical protein